MYMGPLVVFISPSVITCVMFFFFFFDRKELAYAGHYDLTNSIVYQYFRLDR